MPDDSPGTAARDALLSELEARMLVASLRTRLFQRPDLPVRLGRYRLLGRLGEGGMGTVFAAHDEQLDRRVAVKLLHTTRGKSGATPLARLRREAQALARLSHPNVVQVFEIDEFDGQAFVAMELVRGVTLRAWLAQRTRGLDEILEVFIQAGHGLAAAHAAGLVHRDFKPKSRRPSQTAPQPIDRPHSHQKGRFEGVAVDRLAPPCSHVPQVLAKRWQRPGPPEDQETHDQVSPSDHPRHL